MGVGLYSSFRAYLRVIYGYVGLEVVGAEKIVHTGPLLVAVNHCSYLDPLAIGVVYPRILTFMARKSLFENPYFGRFIRQLFAFPVDREGDPRYALRMVEQCMKEDRAVVIFPEGTRSMDGHLKPFEAGVGMISQRNDAPVQPCYIWGAWQGWPKGQKYPRLHPIRVYIGEPVVPVSGVRGGAKRREQERINEEVRARMLGLERLAWGE